MRIFSPKAFEHLLFPLNPKIYRGIDKVLNDIELQFPGSTEHLINLFQLCYNQPTNKKINIPNNLRNYGVPVFDIYIDIPENDFSKLAFTENYCSFITQHDSSYSGKGSHLIVSLKYNGQKSEFICPLQLILTGFESKVCNAKSYQVYEHTLIKKKDKELDIETRSTFLEGSASYVGMTKRSWKTRYKEHQSAAKRGSKLLFHRAIREEFFPVLTSEHIILRAGITSEEALLIEEVEVDSRTLSSKYKNGLNMIPGGHAGLKIISKMANIHKSKLDPDKNEVVLETALACSKGEKIHNLWKQDLDYRIKVLTSGHNRFSYNEILKVREWKSLEWDYEKIKNSLVKFNGKEVSDSRLKSLLRDKTYCSIP
jgi:hypothetical protein